MKNFYFNAFTRTLLILWILSIHAGIYAQVNEQPVIFKAGNFIPDNNLLSGSLKKEDLSASLWNGRYYVLVRFTSLPSPETKLRLKEAGLELGSYIPRNAFLAMANADLNFPGLIQFGVSSVNVVAPEYKTEPSVQHYQVIQSKDDRKTFAVSYFPSVERIAVVEAMKHLGAIVVPSKFDNFPVVYIEPAKDIVKKIAELPFVISISVQNLTEKALNYNSMGLHSVDALLSPSGRNLSGRNITVGVGDNAEITTHIDFTNRVINRVYFLPSYHGIHTSGTVGGAGNLNVRNHGFAPKSTIVSQWFSDIITNTPTYITDYNMIATNNSYTYADDGCPGEGIYDASSNYADAQMKIYETVLHVFATGNDGFYSCSPYPVGFGTIKTGWQCAKNVISVGAINQADYSLAGFSSRGPVQDGRIKPEIVAAGLSVLSTIHNNNYGLNSGTSIAAPAITGSATILNERYRQLNGGSTPKASLIKALMCNTAEDLGNPGPDYTFGFGMLNVRKAVEAMETGHYFISSTAPATYPVNVPAGVRRLKVMLYWADPAALANAGSTLVNDLDLSVTAPGPVTVLPLVLDPTPANVNLAAVQGADHRNNIEQVVIDNPPAGIFNFNVNAFSVPQGPQEYVLTYQFDMNGITVEYPFGGETWVPGESENIRWTANGDEANSFSIDSSFDNGVSWGTINNNVPANARSYIWTVPASVTNSALIRVRRNSSVYSGQSSYTFMVLGQPTLTTTVPCEGFAQLDWSATPVSGAGSYDIYQLKADSMQVIGNTTGTSWLVAGLNSSTTYWFGVAAKNNTVAGRRSISKGVIAATGTCSLPAYDNNFKAVSIDAPVTGRQFTTGALTNAESVKFTIKNLDNITSMGGYNLYYSINGGVPVMETAVIPIAPLGTYQYTFIQSADLSSPGLFNIKAWVKHTGDTQVSDDTVIVTIKNLANPALTLPLTDGFEGTTVKDYTGNAIGFDGDDRVDLKSNAPRGRARTFVNTGFALNGNRAITLDQFPMGTLVTDSLLMTFNVNAYNSGNQLRIEFNYKNHGQANNPNNKVWIRGSDANPWVYAYDLVANQGALGQWKHGFINVNDVLDTVLPAQPVSSSFQVKFGEQGNTSANVANPLLDQDDGYTFDDVSLKEALNDVAINSIISPAITGCGLTGSVPVSIRVKNFSASSFTNVPVSYRINGGAVINEVIPSIAPNSTQVFSFATPANLLNNTDYSFDFWLTAPTDNYPGNDSILNYSFHTSPLINSFPYLEGFEGSDGNWFPQGTNSSWQWGTPAKTIINKAANGTRAWVTSLAGNYNNNELSYLYSPCFDLSGLTQPVLSFSLIFSIEDACPCDYTWVDYTTDGGVTWNRLGTNGTGVNWYNDPTGLAKWRTSVLKWHVASYDIPTSGNSVRFRIAMSSDGGFNLEGVGIDDIHVFDKAQVYTGVPLLNTTQNVSGSNWVHFVSGGKRIASLNPNGQNLGNTAVDVYPYSGPVRFQNNQYYLDRNLVIRPAVQPAGLVGVRLYFTDAEAKNLVNASGCVPCSKPGDPYELGITKYSGIAVEENGTLADNTTGSYQFILPSNTDIIPYDNGYYAEFSVSSFSEFWFNNGGPSGINPLPLTLLSFDALKNGAAVKLYWTTDNELDMSKFVVERSADGLNFISLGSVMAMNHSGINNYTFQDIQPLSALNFYRLKMANNDGSFRYSGVRKVNFGAIADEVTVYPNPVVSDRITISSTGNCRTAVVYDAAGKAVRNFILQGRINMIDLKGITNGVYQLKVGTENSVQSIKIVVNGRR